MEVETAFVSYAQHQATSIRVRYDVTEAPPPRDDLSSFQRVKTVAAVVVSSHLLQGDSSRHQELLARLLPDTSAPATGRQGAWELGQDS